MSRKPRQMPDPRAPVPEGAQATTVFEVRVVGELTSGQRDVLTRSFIRTVTQVTGRQLQVIGYLQVCTPTETAEGAPA
jgi:hypothetical protein